MLQNDIYDLTVPLVPFVQGRVALLGDAAHAMTPNLGRGACSAIEDAGALARHLAESTPWVRRSRPTAGIAGRRPPSWSSGPAASAGSAGGEPGGVCDPGRTVRARRQAGVAAEARRVGWKNRGGDHIPQAPEIPGAKHIHSGKVRDLYELESGELLMVASDRMSAFDWVLETPIPDKGKVLTAMSLWWFEQLGRAEPHAVHRRTGRGRRAAR